MKDDLRPVPTLDELSSDPRRAAELDTDVAETLLSHAIVALAALNARLLVSRAPAGAVVDQPDRLLTVDEASKRLGESRDWTYRHAHKLPFTVRNGRRHLRFSEHGINRYIRARVHARR
jgi:excisionase family DNA binding protein